MVTTQSPQGDYAYAVKGDGASDDTVLLQAALTDTGLRGGGVVVLPIGTIVVTGITVPANVWLRGSGTSSVLKLKAGSNTDTVTLSGSAAKVSDLKILGNSSSQSGGLGAGVFFAADDCIADRVLVSDTFKFGIYAADVQRPAITNCTVLNSLYIGIYVEAKLGTVDVEGPVISDCRVDRSALVAATISEGGLKIHGGAGKVVLRPRISNCHVEMPASPASATAICIETFGGVQRADITGCTTGGGSIGISCDTSPSVSVTGCTLIGAKLYGIEVVASNNAAVVGNTVDGSSLTQRGIAVNGTALSSKAVVVTGNTVTGCTTYGVRSQGAAQITISGNTFQLTGSAGIYVAAATYVTVAGNVVDDQAQTMNDGIFFDNCVYLTCTGNMVSGVDNNGVLVFATSAISIRAFVFANAIDIFAGTAVSTNLSGGATLSTQSQMFGNSDGAVNRLDWASSVLLYSSTGSPEGVVGGGVGSLYLRRDGGANTTLYIKESGAGTTGWIAK